MVCRLFNADLWAVTTGLLETVLCKMLAFMTVVMYPAVPKLHV